MSKDETITIRVSKDEKIALERMADAHKMSLSTLILSMIGSGVSAEKDRRERLRGLVSKMGVI